MREDEGGELESDMAERSVLFDVDLALCLVLDMDVFDFPVPEAEAEAGLNLNKGPENTVTESRLATMEKDGVRSKPSQRREDAGSCS